MWKDTEEMGSTLGTVGDFKYRSGLGPDVLIQKVRHEVPRQRMESNLEETRVTTTRNTRNPSFQDRTCPGVCLKPRQTRHLSAAASHWALLWGLVGSLTD
jgi:hypothetical protein